MTRANMSATKGRSTIKQQIMDLEAHLKTETGFKEAKQVEGLLRFIKSLPVEQHRAIYLGLALVHSKPDGPTATADLKADYYAAIATLRKGKAFTRIDFWLREYNKAIDAVRKAS